MSDNLSAFLDVLAACEGTAGMDGYRTLFGGKKFYNDFIDHPRIRVPFTDKSGLTLTTSAAGRYQFEIATWDRLAHKLWPTIARPMFSPDNQDAAATELVAEQGAMPDVKAGNLAAALSKCSSQWASLPDSRYAQPTRSIFFATNAYLASGGVLG